MYFSIVAINLCGPAFRYLFNFLQMNIWNYSNHKLLHSIETGHSANIFCTKFVPETSDELVVSGAGDAEVIS